jgi:hypothetical protein
MQSESLERIKQLEKSDIFMAASEAAKKLRHLLGLEECIILIKTLDEPDDINDDSRNCRDKERARSKSEEYAGTNYQSS